MNSRLHHVALRCRDRKNYEETLDFYQKVMDMKVRYSWGEDAYAATMLELDGGVIEIFATGRAPGEIGAINHFCFETMNPVESVEKVMEAGYPILVPPTKVNLSLTEGKDAGKTLRLTYAYCMGPVGEIIEFYREDEVE